MHDREDYPSAMGITCQLTEQSPLGANRTVDLKEHFGGLESSKSRHTWVQVSAYISLHHEMCGSPFWTNIITSSCLSLDGDHLTCLLRNLYEGQEATVRTRHGTTDWFQIGKGVRQGCILSPCLFNFYAEDIMRNAGLEETQAGMKIAGRNINNLRYADDTTLMAESEEELKSLLMKVKEDS